MSATLGWWALALLLLPFRALAEPWDSYNDPSRFGQGYEFRFMELPLSGGIDPAAMPWSETFWPRNRGSINYRWNGSPRVGIGYRSPTREEVRAMRPEELARLAPTEKYDLFLGHYDYPLKNYIARVDSDRNAPDWSGICDGWTVASIEFREPKPVTRINPDGVAIPFGASDVKGLISYTAARQPLDSVVIGRYCPWGLGLGFGNCRDVNPGAYHVILANEIGIRKTPFPGEIDPGKEAWNQPLVGYEFTVVGSAASESNGPAVRIRSKLRYVDELDRSQWEPVTGTASQQYGVQVSDYVLELDLGGRITGGYWISKHSHPDVFWKPRREIRFEGRFEAIRELYEPI